MCSLLPLHGREDWLCGSSSGGVNNHRSVLMLHIPLLYLNTREILGLSCYNNVLLLLTGQCSISPPLFSLHIVTFFLGEESQSFFYTYVYSHFFSESSALKCQLSSSNKAVIIYKFILCELRLRFTALFILTFWQHLQVSCGQLLQLFLYA